MTVIDVICVKILPELRDSGINDLDGVEKELAACKYRLEQRTRYITKTTRG